MQLNFLMLGFAHPVLILTKIDIKFDVCLHNDIVLAVK